jgi:hypothetical protein
MESEEAADEAVLNNVHKKKKIQQIPPLKEFGRGKIQAAFQRNR